MSAARAVPPERALVPDELSTLRLLADTLISRSVALGPSHPSARVSASDAGVDRALATVVEQYLSDAEARQFRQLLRVVNRPMMTLLLTGRPQRFDRLDAAARERFLLAWADSRLGVKRRAFRAIKRLTLFLYYAPEDATRAGPAWTDIGYAPARPTPGEVAEPSALPAAIEPPEDGRLETDVCVIGSGAGGSVVAARAAAAGYRTLVLEAGPELLPSALPSSEGPGFDRLYHSHGLLGTRDQAFSVLAGTTVGGSTAVNWMTCLRPSDFVRREWEALGMHGVVGAEFDRSLANVEARLHVGREESTVNANNDVLARGCAALGFRAGVDFETIARNAVGCRGRCQPCSFGCPYRAKQSSAETYLADARRAGARLMCRARAETVEIEHGRVRGVRAIWTGGGAPRTLEIRTPTVVVAGGAVESPALLLRSGLKEPVGRGLHLHPTSAVLGEHPHPIRMWEGPMQTVVVRRFQSADPARRGPWLESTPAHPGLAAQAAPWRGSDAHRRQMLRLDRAAATIALVRDSSAGRVRIDAEGRAVLEYRMAPRDRANLTVGLVEAARIQRAAGALRVGTLHNRGYAAGDGVHAISDAEFDRFEAEVTRAGVRENAIGLFSAHPTGSLAIGRDPSCSATDARGAVWGIEGLWVADGSLLPTAPGVNPMISIMAVAERTAASLLADLGGAPGGTKR